LKPPRSQPPNTHLHSPKPTACRKGGRDHPKTAYSRPPTALETAAAVALPAARTRCSPYIPWSMRWGRLQHFCVGWPRFFWPRHGFVCKTPKTLASLSYTHSLQRSSKTTSSDSQMALGRCLQAQTRRAARAARAVGGEGGCCYAEVNGLRSPATAPKGPLVAGTFRPDVAHCASPSGHSLWAIGRPNKRPEI
jgi:hypothetical protein